MKEFETLVEKYGMGGLYCFIDIKTVEKGELPVLIGRAGIKTRTLASYLELRMMKSILTPDIDDIISKTLDD